MRRLLATALLLTLPAAAHAQSGLLSGLFAGAAWQSASLDESSGSGTGNTLTNGLKTGTGLLLVAGWQPTSLLGVVARSASTNYDLESGGGSATITQTEVVARLTLPLSIWRLRPFAEAGFALREFDRDVVTGVGSAVAQVRADGNTPIVGAGLRVQLLRGVLAEGAFHVTTADFSEWKLNGAAITGDAIKGGTARITVGVVVHPFALLTR